MLSRLAVGVRVDGDDETQRKEHEREGDQEETRHGSRGVSYRFLGGGPIGYVS